MPARVRRARMRARRAGPSGSRSWSRRWHMAQNERQRYALRHASERTGRWSWRRWRRMATPWSTHRRSRADWQVVLAAVADNDGFLPLTRLSFCCTPPGLPLVGVSIGMERGCQQNNSLVRGYVSGVRIGGAGRTGRWSWRRWRRTAVPCSTHRRSWGGPGGGPGGGGVQRPLHPATRVGEAAGGPGGGPGGGGGGRPQPGARIGGVAGGPTGGSGGGAEDCGCNQIRIDGAVSWRRTRTAPSSPPPPLPKLPPLPLPAPPWQQQQQLLQLP